jgi:acetamidase/formamidase
MFANIKKTAVASFLALSQTVAIPAAAAEFKPDAVLPSTPKTVVRGYIASDTPPVLHIKSGQSVKIDTISHGGLTEDPVAFAAAAGIPANQVLKDAIDIGRLSKEKGWGGHVLTGPVFVDGAHPGDMLEVRILKIDIRAPFAVNNPGNGGVAPDILNARGSKVIKFDLARNVALFSKDIEIPLAPFMGIMAVAPPPEIKRVSSGPPGAFGGNMDFKRLTAGATLYLPVFNEGALFVTGDSHGGQGDGEVDGNAMEASMAPTLQFIVHPGMGKAMTYPRAEDAQNFYILGMDPDLDLALKKAVKETVIFLQGRGLSASDAYSLASVGVDFAVSEAVDRNLVIYGKIPKAIFKTKQEYWAAK